MGKARVRWFAVLGFALALILIGFFEPKGLKETRKVLLTLYGRSVQPMGCFLDALRTLWSKYIWLVSVAEENKRLKEELERLRLERMLLLEKAEEAEKFRELLAFKASSGFEVEAAEVVAIWPRPRGWCFMVDKGTSRGIKKGMPVISPEGLVGKVWEVEEKKALIVPIIQTGMAVSVEVKEVGVRGILQGREGRLRLLYVTTDHPLREGQRLFTTGFDGVYPPSIPVGWISSLKKARDGLFWEAEVKPFVDFSRLKVLFVVKGS